ncbi:MAG: hypothetical protein ABIJ09_05435 [Pseudomonadota bacterium]
MPRASTFALALLCASTVVHAEAPPRRPAVNRHTPAVDSQVVAPAPASSSSAPSQPLATDPNKLWYTTYFYTATEAVVHGYEKDTSVRIVSLDKKRTVWQGVVQPGQTRLIPTGQGVFSFLSDKKAAILVGTPSSCAVAGYWVRDQNGSFRSQRFYSALPSSGFAGDERVIAWAWDDLSLRIVDVTTDKVVFEGALKKDSFHDISGAALAPLHGHTLLLEASKPALSAQVYYDEGFFLPAESGLAAGKRFRTYVGKITQGMNDLNLISHQVAATVTVRDLKSQDILWKGTVPAGGIHTLTLTQKYVEVTSTTPIVAVVAPLVHESASGYAEHHFAAGLEGMGIENDFLLPTPNELWLFSYYTDNHIIVSDASGKEIWKGTLGAGHVQGVHPGRGFYRVKGDKGLSVMGGASSCGAEFSPAGGLFRVDEELLKVATTILEERRMKAQAEGRVLTPAEAAAPLTSDENIRAQRSLKANTGQSLSADEVQERMNAIQNH